MKKRIAYLDYLRVFATFAVIILHVVAQKWYRTDVNTFEWQILNIYGSIVRWGVPIFVMISGSLFLEREYSLKKIYGKNILRLLIAFFFWSFIYAIIEGGDAENILLNIGSGHYHMWFIPMIGWLYICTPILRKIAESEEVMKYFLILAFLFSFLFPQIVQLVNDFGGEQVIKFIDVFDNIFALSNFYYTSYFIGGLYLSRIDLSKRIRQIIYFLGLLGAILTIVLDAFLSVQAQDAVEVYGGNFSIPILMQSIAIFVWMKYHVPKQEKLNEMLHRLSKYSFGAYLIHALIIEQLNITLGVHPLSFQPTLSVPVIGSIVFVLSFSISALIHKIPFLNKYIV